MTLAPSLAPLVKQSGCTVREAVAGLAAQGFRAVQLDAALPGIRPRDLSPRARQDLTSLLMRQNLRPAGLDLFIPRRHFTESAHLDRAMAATLAAIELAADLGRIPVSLALPVTAVPEDARQAMVEAADGRGVRLAVHAEDQLDALTAWMERVDTPNLGAAMDPAAILALDQDVLAVTQRLGQRLTVARLSDQVASAGGVRCEVGQGDLDVERYRVMLDLSAGRAGPVVLDLRGLADPRGAAGAALKAWDDAAFHA